MYSSVSSCSWLLAWVEKDEGVSQPFVFVAPSSSSSFTAQKIMIVTSLVL